MKHFIYCQERFRFCLMVQNYPLTMVASWPQRCNYLLPHPAITNEETQEIHEVCQDHHVEHEDIVLYYDLVRK